MTGLQLLSAEEAEIIAKHRAEVSIREACEKHKERAVTVPPFDDMTGVVQTPFKVQDIPCAGLAIDEAMPRATATPYDPPARFRRPPEVLGIQTESNERHHVARVEASLAVRALEQEHPSLPRARSHLAAALELLR